MHLNLILDLNITISKYNTDWSQTVNIHISLNIYLSTKTPNQFPRVCRSPELKQDLNCHSNILTTYSFSCMNLSWTTNCWNCWMSFWPFAIFENNKKVLSLITKIRSQIANCEPLIRTLNKVYQNTQKHYFSQSKEVARLFKYSKRTLFSFSQTITRCSPGFYVGWRKE